VLVAVVRYFGGTKLGVGGLIQAYKTAANDAIAAAKIIKEYIPATYTASFEYARMGDVMGTVEKYGWNVLETDFQLSCKLTFSCKLSEQEQVELAFEPLHDVELLISNG
jgi:putative IMPACT (imprinted ancient) family translation regulator